MSKFVKKLLSISCAVCSVFSFYSIVGAMTDNIEEQKVVPVSTTNEEEKKEDKEVMSTNIAGGLTNAVTDIAKKTGDVVSDEIKDQIDEHKEKTDDMKEQFSNLLESVNDNLTDISKKHEDAQSQATEQAKKVEELKQKEDQINEMKKNMDIQNKLKQKFEEFDKTQDQAINDMKNQVNDVLTSATDQQPSTDEKN